MSMSSIGVVALAAGVLSASTIEPAESGTHAAPEIPEERRSSLVQRPPTPRTNDHQAWEPGPAVYPLTFRSIDGVGNNERRVLWGAAGITMLRTVPAVYLDRSGTPDVSGLPSAREVSNLIAASHGSIPNAVGATDYLWQWGQFIDHDITETPVASPAEAFDIAVPLGDPWFDPFGTGTQTIGLDRSAGVFVDGVREQLNNITAYIDASMVYGSDAHRAAALRMNNGTGRLATSDGDLLPFNTLGLHNAPTDHDPSFFLAGDIRANEQVGLTAVHTLFVREHNRRADEIRGNHPDLTGDEIYERARAIVAAHIQAVTYNEFLPLLLGPGTIPSYGGYNIDVDASISNEFATAAYRVGHTMLSSTLMRVHPDGTQIDAGHLSLADAFFVPQETIDHGIEPVLRGLAEQRAQEIDAEVIDDVRNFLFGPPGSGGFDLASLNVQRGRDHGLGSYNDIRVAFGLPAATSFAQITGDPGKATALADAYASVDDVDAWVGLLCEPHAQNAMVGETLQRVLTDQFVRLRDGDRFWFEIYLPPSLADEVNTTLLSDIINRNMHGPASMRTDVFMMSPECEGDMNRDGAMTVADVSAFVAHFTSDSLRADLTDDRRLTFEDISVFIDAFGRECE
jgi:peroxidase